METGIARFQNFTSGAIRFEVPPYQREFQWGPEQWEALWQDLGLIYRKTLSKESFPRHFMGIILVDPLHAEGIGGASRFAVIDGQQRLTTVLILLAAIRDADLERRGESLRENHQLFFVRNNDDVVEGPRLQAQEADQSQLHLAMTGQWRSWYSGCTKKSLLTKSRILHCYLFFRYCLWRGTDSFDEADISIPHYRKGQAAHGLSAEEVWVATGNQPAEPSGEINLNVLDNCVRTELEVLELRLTNADEDAPTIFESINAKRTQLQQWDFIRNLIFTRFDHARAGVLYENQWKAVQKSLSATKYEGKRSDSRDAFVYDYLIARGEHKEQKSVSKNRGYEHLHNRITRLVPRTPEGSYQDRLQDFVTSDFLIAARCWPVAVGGSTAFPDSTPALSDSATQVIESIGKLSSGPAFPAVLHYVEGYYRSEIPEGDLVTSLKLIETFLARTILARRPLSPLRSTFMGIMDQVHLSFEPERLKSVLVGSTSSAGPMPPDSDIMSLILESDFYGSNISGSQLGAIFRGLERKLAGPAAHPLPYGSGEADMSVEHVFPQSCVTPPHASWSEDLKRWRVDGEEMAIRLNRLGNLTLLTNAANKASKAKPFADKQRVLGGADPKVPHPILQVSEKIVSASRWKPGDIDNRTKWIASRCLETWPFPD